MHIGWPKFVIAVVALASGGTATALGFGAIRSSITLGQPLSLAVPVHLDEGESLNANCASAEVVAGETKLPPGTVSVRVTQGRDASENVLRITTSSVVAEPVLTVTFNAGCPTRMTRTLVLLADPPLVGTDNIVLAPPPVAAVVEPAEVPQAAPDTSVSAAPVAAQTRATRPRQVSPRPPRSTAAGVTPRAAPAKPIDATAAPRPKAKAALRVAARTEPKSRLRLEATEVNSEQATVLAAQEQASAARATASAAEAAMVAAEQRMRAMETEMKLLRADAKAQTEALMQLRQQMEQRDKPSTLTALLLGLAAALVVLVAWLGWRLHAQAQAPQPDAWWDRAAVEEADDVVAEFRESSRASVAGRLTSAPAPLAMDSESEPAGLDSMLSPPTVPAPTAVTIPPVSAREAEMSRAMSVDEQIDLEQQADFFIALGHDEAAIDLLMAHLRTTGGGSPLPFLKLLDIHRRRDQHEAYERTRVRFNQRFNGVAPEWDADPRAGRTLEDYPQVVRRLQAAWPKPLDAMVDLEAMLFRRGQGAELFDLPAYQEVLFLYQMARDLNQQGSEGIPDVDVLLPMGGGVEPPPTPDDGTLELRPEFRLSQPLELNLGGNDGPQDRRSDS